MVALIRLLLQCTYVDAILPLRSVTIAGGVVRRIQLGEQIWVVWAWEIRQVERRLAVHFTTAKGANQFALCWWCIPEAAVRMRHTGLTTCRSSKAPGLESIASMGETLPSASPFGDGRRDALLVPLANPSDPRDARKWIKNNNKNKLNERALMCTHK